MNNRIRLAFLFLIVCQGFHSIEEYYGRLWEVFPPAQFVCHLISPDLETGFLVINIGLFTFGLFCWVASTLRRRIRFQGLIWFWIIIETINGIGHPIWALMEKSYAPGVATAPVLLILSLYLGRQLSLYSRSKSVIAS